MPWSLVMASSPRSTSVVSVPRSCGERFAGARRRRCSGGEAELAEQGLGRREAPKCSMETIRPASPANWCHGSAMPASTETRAVTDGGSTDSRYALSCSSNHSTHGIDTTRVAMPSASSASRASTASCTSEPVADEDDLRRPGRRLGQDVRRPWRRPRATSPSSVGTFCRVSASPNGPVACARGSPARRRAVSLASPGRTIDQARDRAQRGQVLDRLVGRPVLAEADRVVRPHVGDRDAASREASRTAPRM